MVTVNEITREGTFWLGRSEELEKCEERKADGPFHRRTESAAAAIA